MTKNFVRFITLLLVLCLSISLFAGCNKKPDETFSSNVSSHTDDVNSDDPMDEDTVSDDTASTDNEWVDFNDGTDYEDEETLEESEDFYLQDLYVDNTQVLNPDFGGINGIYEMFNYIDDKDGRQYNDEQIALQMDFLETMRVKQIRSYYSSLLSWDPVTQQHDFESKNMQAFYQNCRDLDEIGVEIGITMQWDLAGFLAEKKSTNTTFKANIVDNGYVVPGDLNATANGFRKFTQKSVLAFKAHGIHNIKYIFAFTECNNLFTSENDGDNTLEDRDYERIYPIFDAGIRALDSGLKDAGLRDKYQIVGPCDATGVQDGSEMDYSRLVKYVGDHLKDEIDIIGSHHGGYVKSPSYTNDVFYDLPQYNVITAMNQAKEMGKKYWWDETNVGISDTYGPENARKFVNTDPWKGVALGAMINSAMNLDYLSNMFIWAYMDQQWPGSNSGGAYSEFDNGVQLCGYIPVFFESITPYKPWYSLSLLSRYVGSGQTYACEVGSGVYISAIKRTDGEWTVVVTNYNFENTPINIHFAKSMGGKDFYRYIYNPITIEPAEGTEMIKADAVAENITTGFSDTLPSGCVAIYTTEKPN